MDILKQKRNAGEPRRRGPHFSLNDRAKLMMKYIWRWKIASTSSIHEAVNRTASPYSTFKTLERLEKHGFIEAKFEFGERFYVWQLTPLGFRSIRNYLGELKEEGYLSENHYHDRLVQAFHLGEWATYQFPNVTMLTEQEMRRREVTDYPAWVPQTGEHRPDGYTRIQGPVKPVTLAIEVELSAKNVQKYEAILRFYRTARIIDRVLWLVDSPVLKDTILRAKDCIRDDSNNYHLFVGLDDYIKNGWDAAVFSERSENLFTMRGFLGGLCGETYRDILGKFKGQSRVNVHLAKQKVIGKTRT